MSTQDKKDSVKKQLIMQVSKMPIVRAACDKVGVSRASYYRWRKQDSEFCEAIDLALQSGKDEVNDVAESQLIRAIQAGNLTGIIYWLKNNHVDYNPKLAHKQSINRKNEALNDEEKKILDQALELLKKDLPISLKNNES